jgi:hypothetical protein
MFFADARNRAVAPPVLWLDLFCVNQHTPESPCEQLVQSHALPAMRQCSRLILVPGTWKRSPTLQRTWCLFELEHAHRSSFPVFLALVPAQRVLFLRFLQQLGSHKEFSDAIGRVQLEQSACSRCSDRQWLLQELEPKTSELQRPAESAGVERSVVRALRGWLLLQLRQQLASTQAAPIDAAASAKWMSLIAELLADADEKEEAAAMYQDALVLIKGLCGPQHARTISCSWELAKLLVKLERYARSGFSQRNIVTLCTGTATACRSCPFVLKPKKRFSVQQTKACSRCSTRSRRSTRRCGSTRRPRRSS